MANLQWIRDCCFLLVTNLPTNVTTNALQDYFRVVGPILDLFVPRNRLTELLVDLGDLALFVLSLNVMQKSH